MVYEGRTVKEAQVTMIKHLFSGDCTSGLGQCCHEMRLQVRYGDRGSIVTQIVARLKAMDSRSLPDETLLFVCSVLNIQRIKHEPRANLLIALADYAEAFVMADLDRVTDLAAIEDMDPRDLSRAAYAHGLPWRNVSCEEMKSTLYKHLLEGGCVVDGDLERLRSPSYGCVEVQRTRSSGDVESSRQRILDVKITLIRKSVASFSARGIRRLLPILGVSVPPDTALGALRAVLRKYLGKLVKGKSPDCDDRSLPTPDSDNTIIGGRIRTDHGQSFKVDQRCTRTRRRRHRMRSTSVTAPDDPENANQEPQNTPSPAHKWPQLVPPSLKKRIVSLFRHATSRDVMSVFTCAVCGELKRIMQDRRILKAGDFDHNLLRGLPSSSIEASPEAFSPPSQDSWDGVLLDQNGVVCEGESGTPELHVCSSCHTALTASRPRLPALALANGLDPGAVPNELKDLTQVEESMIALCRAKCWILQLKEGPVPSPNAQRGIRGHAIIFPQRPERLTKVLPPSMEDVVTHICVIFVGSKRPSDEWIRTKAKPLLVRRERVRKALEWLKRNNPLYKDVVIDPDRIRQLPVQAPLPVHIQYQESVDGANATTSNYDPTLRGPAPAFNKEVADDSIFQSVVVADVDGDTSGNALSAAAHRHLTITGNAFVEIPHGNDPVNEFYNPTLFPMTYPTLFPYGKGGFEDGTRRVPVSMERHVGHLLRLADKRFQEHPSFMFVAFNILQRRQALRQTKFKVGAPRFRAVAARISTVSSEAIQAVTERVARGEPASASNAEEFAVLQLMKEVRMVTRQVSGSAAARTAMRNEIRGLMMTCGTPSYFITINPADVYNPLVKFLAGSDIDVDNLLPEDVPAYWPQSMLVAKNPAVAAQFFNVVMKAFIENILGYGCKDEEIAHSGGILGKVKAYYGCVEAQGRGTLHCHMLVWIEGALNPNEIRDRIMADPTGQFVRSLIETLDDTISTCIPFDKGDQEQVLHPCSWRGVRTDDPEYEEKRKADLHHLVQYCQVHGHNETCFKYSKGQSEPDKCRFGLGEARFRGVTTVDPESGEIRLRCLDGLVNNFNETIIEAICCNMDIKFIGSGREAKAVLYYITDYITKTQLKAHVAFAALELAVKKLQLPSLDEEADTVVRAKRLLQKCAYAMIAHQEMSGQQVASYILGYEDHFKSHEFRCLWWTSFEAAVERMGGELQPKSVDAKELVDDHDEQSTFESDDDDDNGTMDDGEGNEMATTAYIGEDVTIERDGDELLPRSGAVADYILRGEDFEHMSVWDFISGTRKSRRATRKKKHAAGDDNDAGTGLLINDACDESDDPDYGRDAFLKGHMERETHLLRKLRQNAWVVPVPIGPGLPRRDAIDVRDRHCRLMLIFFKPWRAVRDLIEEYASWEDAFSAFVAICSSTTKQIMENMQMLHECRDDRDNHYAHMRAKGADSSGVVPSAWVEDGRGENDNDEMYAADTSDDVLIHLESITEARSRNALKSSESAKLCVDAAENAGLFGIRANAGGDVGDGGISHDAEISVGDLRGHEAEWKRAYEQQRQARKRLAMELSSSTSGGEATCLADDPEVRVMNEATAGLDQPYVREVAVDATHQELVPTRADIGEMIGEFTLNAEQALAFRIICEAVERRDHAQLLMYIGGSGGTGKSRVINAVREFFVRRNESRRLRLTSYTGVAAHNVTGMTLHAALNLGTDNKRTKGARTQKDLRAMWEGVDFLFVDEVSMLGCKTLLNVHNALTIAKGSTESFGGINVIFAGDFAQLSPVGERRLFTKLDTRLTGAAGTTSGQDNIMGKLLWLQVKEVVMLRQQMRQAGSANASFVGILERLRVGKCTDEDYRVLNTRLTTSIGPSLAREWAGCPIIVAENGPKDALNERAAEMYASSMNLPLTWYYAADYNKGRQIVDSKVLDAISKFHSGQTGHRLFRLPAVRGMPVMLAQNYDVENGVVNGAVGRLKSVRYTVSEVDGVCRRRARSCVIESGAYSGERLPHLEDREFVALEDSVNVRLTHPYSFGRWDFKRHQLPVVPAFAITVYKAQGLTFPKVVVDLQSCKSLEAAYVMLSRVKSLDGLLILRSFDRSKITTRQSEDTRNEFARLDLLGLFTLAKHSQDPSVRDRAMKEIAAREIPAPKRADYPDSREALEEFQERVQGLDSDIPKRAAVARAPKRRFDAEGVSIGRSEKRRKTS